VAANPKSHYEKYGVCTDKLASAPASSGSVSGGKFKHSDGSSDGVEGVTVHSGPDGEELALWFQPNKIPLSKHGLFEQMSLFIN
jgi:hypothetical protein